ncbi:MAG: ATP-binding protein, partial [Pseudomonadales bacterium]
LGEAIDLRVEPSADLWLATFDRHQFENALVNLAINARDAMPDGGVLTIETANIVLDANDADQYEDVTPGDYVMVAVSDAGTGMPPEVIDKVFEPFFTTKDVGEGSGLGLSSVYGFAKQSLGHVTIDSEEGRGTTVKLYMPRSTKTAVEEDANEYVQEIARGTGRVLVVEDDERVLEVSANTLRDGGYEVVEARNGDEAVNHLRENQPFDLLFTDVVLPGARSGVDIAQEAKQLQPHIKVIYSTGYAKNAVMRKGKLGRGAIVVSKPYRRAELLETVQNMLASNNN